MQWPPVFDTDRIEALTAVDLARVHVQAALSDAERMQESGVRARVACRLCWRMVVVAATTWPGGRRFGGRLRALCDLIEQHAQEGIALSVSVCDSSLCAGDRRRALVDLLGMLADLGFYLEVLGRDWPGEVQE